MSDKKVFLFAGQGSQYVGMGKDLYENYSIAKKYFDQADEIIPGLKKVCFEGPEEELKLTKYTQPGIFTVSVILNDILKEKGWIPDIVAGFSLGEYSAFYSAEVFDFETGINLVKVRGDAMNHACEKNPGTMAAILGLEDTVVQEVCKQITAAGDLVVPVNYNSPGQLVISGTKSGIEKAVAELENRDAKRAVILQVSGAFHSPLMDPAQDTLQQAISLAKLNVPIRPIVMNVTAQEQTDLTQIKDLMVKQLVSPVLWKQSITYLIQKGYTQFYEIGPGKVLSGFMRSIDKTKTITSFKDHADLVKINI